jgi:hypothetical protein
MEPDLCDGRLKYPNSYQKGRSKATSRSTRKKARRGEEVREEILDGRGATFAARGGTWTWQNIPKGYGSSFRVRIFNGRKHL